MLERSVEVTGGSGRASVAVSDRPAGMGSVESSVRFQQFIHDQSLVQRAGNEPVAQFLDVRAHWRATGRWGEWAVSSTHAWTIEELVEVDRRQGKLKFLFFWSHRARSGQKIGPHVLSQWYPTPFEVDGVRYPTAEHFMMAEKARLFRDEVTLRDVLAARSPGAAKAAGRRVAAFDETIWAEHRSDIVTRACLAKFGSDVQLRSFLQNTGSRVLAEASPHDRIWGIGLDEQHSDACRPGRWRGLNLLGFALMEARAELSS